MAQIYSNAGFRIRVARQPSLLHRCGAPMWHEALQTDSGLPRAGTAMHHLFTKEYRNRGWVVQGFVLAKQLQIRYGAESLDSAVMEQFFKVLVNDNLYAWTGTVLPSSSICEPTRYSSNGKRRERSFLPRCLSRMPGRPAPMSGVMCTHFLASLAATVENPFPVDYSTATTAEVLLLELFSFCRLHPVSTMAPPERSTCPIRTTTIRVLNNQRAVRGGSVWVRLIYAYGPGH